MLSILGISIGRVVIEKAIPRPLIIIHRLLIIHQLGRANSTIVSGVIPYILNAIGVNGRPRVPRIGRVIKRYVFCSKRLAGIKEAIILMIPSLGLAVRR